MAPLLDRRNRVCLVVEPLEDRRLLSHYGLAAGWAEAPTSPPVADREATPVWGPIDGSGSSARASDLTRSTFAESVSRGDGRLAVFDQRSTTGNGLLDSTVRSNLCAPLLSTASTAIVTPASSYSPGSALTAFESAWSAASAPVVAASHLGSGMTAELDSRVSSGSLPPILPSSIPGPGLTPHAVAPVLIARSVEEYETTAHLDRSTSDILEAPVHFANDEGPMLGAINLSLPQGSKVEAPARALIPFNINAGPPGPTDLPAGQTTDTGLKQGISTTWASSGRPQTSTWDRETGELEGSPPIQLLSRTGPADDFEVPDPQMADMIMSLLPFDHSTLDLVVDRFLEPLENLSGSIPEFSPSVRLLSASLTVAVAVMTTDLALRIRRSRQDQREFDGEESLVPFPGLPTLGKTRRS